MHTNKFKSQLRVTITISNLLLKNYNTATMCLDY